MIISILTLFPDMFTGPFDFSILKRARDKKLCEINLINVRDFATDSYKTVDDHPYGGGVGMILKVDIVDKALTAVKAANQSLNTRTILLDPKGTLYAQQKARELSLFEHLILICGHYEGVDHRVSSLVDEVVSLGNFIVTGGELPSMIITDSVIRLLPGVLAKESATITESFTENKLEAPHYTRPETYKGMQVPDVLLSGHHKKITEWKQQESKILPDKK